MKEFASLLFRGALVAVCAFATWMSVLHARAEFIAHTGVPRDVERALAMEPESLEIVAAAALMKSDSDDPSPAVNEQLQRASRMNPYNAQLLVALGLRAESQGDTTNAERYFARATEVDRRFMPAWTYANYCVRTGQVDKFWTLAQRCLSLDPLLFDPRPVFNLAWRMTDDPQKVRGMLPRAGLRLVDYLGYLLETNRVGAAAGIWPDALASLDPSLPPHINLALAYCDMLSRNNRMPDAVRVWNQLVDRKIVHSGHLNPANSVSIADPEFSFPPSKGLFDWQVTGADGVFVTSGASALRFELDGNEPEALPLLSTHAAVLPHRAYRLVWKYDSSQLSSQHDRGFDIRVIQPGGAASECEPFLKAEDGGKCTFTTGPNVQSVGIELRYARAQGTTRIRGLLLISDIHLEFGS